MKYKIFGKKIEIINNNMSIQHIIQEEFQNYIINDKEINEESEIEIIFINDIDIKENYSNSPSIHSTCKYGFLANYGDVKIYYNFKEKLRIYIELKYQNNLKTKILKFLNIGYKNNIENITAVLHELVLVPANYYYIDKVLIHASAVKNLKNNKTILFGGTGGVGKTSLELLLCRELNYSFISDDMAIIDDKGFIYPNLAYPKIYAYNVNKNKEIKKLLFKNRNFLDKLQWNIFNTFRGPSYIRRTISPKKIYKSIEINPNKIEEYYILSRESSIKDIEIEKIPIDIAKKLTFDIILNEYFSFNQHITWHEYNSTLIDIKPILQLKIIEKRWKETYSKIFTNIECYHIKIPIDIKHEDFLSYFKEKFKNE